MITAHTGETRNGFPCAELREGSTVIAKVYANEEGTKIRIVLPELVNMKQTLVSMDNHLVEFTRSADGGLQDAARTPPAAADMKCSVAGCTRLASFIIRRKSFCEEHRER